LVPQLRPCSRAGTSYTLPQILIGTVVLAFLFGIATTWWENYRVAKALASNSSFDEESPILRSRPPHTGALRYNSSRRKCFARPVTTVIEGQMWGNSDQDQET